MTKKRSVETEGFEQNPFLNTRQARWFDGMLDGVPADELIQWESADIDTFIIERYLAWYSKGYKTAQERIALLDIAYYRGLVEQVIMSLRLR